MGYFDGMTDGNFKTDSKGRKVFYPWGIIGKGYVLPNKETEERVRTSTKRFFTVTFISMMAVGLIFNWLYAFGIIIVAFMWYVFLNQVTLKGLETAAESLSIKESYANSAQSHNSPMLWFSFIGSLLLVALGAIIWITGKAALGITTILLFALNAIATGYMIISRSRPK